MGEIKRSPTTEPVQHAVVQPILLDPSRQSPQAAINAVNADSEKANMMNNMHGGWVPNPPKTKVVKSKKVKGGRGRGRRRSYRTRRRYSRSNVYDARVSRRLRMRMLQRRIKKRKSRRHGSQQRQLQLQLQMRGGSGQQVPLQPAAQTVPQHGSSCTAGDTNCAGNITQGILSVNAQAVANSRGDNVSASKV